MREATGPLTTYELASMAMIRAGIGVVDSEPNVRNKLSRGKFAAVFLLQCLEAIGTSSLRLQD